MALLGLKVEGGPYRNLQRAAKPAREEEKETEAPVEQNSSSKRPTGLWDDVNRRRNFLNFKNRFLCADFVWGAVPFATKYCVGATILVPT